jgi:hypothetical protein
MYLEILEIFRNDCLEYWRRKGLKKWRRMRSIWLEIFEEDG